MSEEIMISLLLIHPILAKPHLEAPSKREPSQLQIGKMPRLAWQGLLSLIAIASILSIAPDTWALQLGDRGSEVSRLQSALGIPVDGVFGFQTEAAVLDYQRRCGLQVDGIAGTETLSSLAARNCSGGFLTLRPDSDSSSSNVVSGSSSLSLASGPYVVVVPGDSPTRLADVRRIVSGAFSENSGRGSFINAGSYSSRSSAENVSDRLKDAGLSARVAFRP
ncbi:MAG: peptidoglycan-binding protein [Leptolyngbyaceae cyanobacterium CRU_2_3]|nr:peptidoglycan-binding protein [Leptolyngbyaceae cyanobacterium CRU_2_3]